VVGGSGILGKSSSSGINVDSTAAREGARLISLTRRSPLTLDLITFSPASSNPRRIRSVLFHPFRNRLAWQADVFRSDSRLPTSLAYGKIAVARVGEGSQIKS